MGFRVQLIAEETNNWVDRSSDSIWRLFGILLLLIIALVLVVPIILVVAVFWIWGKFTPEKNEPAIAEDEWVPHVSNHAVNFFRTESPVEYSPHFENYQLRSEPPVPELDILLFTDWAFAHRHYILLQQVHGPDSHYGPHGVAASLLCLDTNTMQLASMKADLPAGRWQIKAIHDNELEWQYYLGETTYTYRITID